MVTIYLKFLTKEKLQLKPFISGYCLNHQKNNEYLDKVAIASLNIFLLVLSSFIFVYLR